MLPGLGTIKLTFTAIRIVGHGDGFTDEVDIPEKRQVSERGKKGIQACVGWVKFLLSVALVLNPASLGQEYYRAPRRHWKCVPMYVIAQLTFQYRPLGAHVITVKLSVANFRSVEYLQAQGIAPIPPPQRPLPLPPPRQELPVLQPGKRKRREAEPQPGPSKVTRIHVKRENRVAILDISDEEDEKLYALRVSL
jgi:hypothetical protein